MKNKGFSLLEMLIAITIILLIGSIAVPKYLNSVNKARWIASREQLKKVAEAFDQYNLDHGYYPEYASWDEIATSDNIVIKEGLIDYIPLKDKFGQKYEGYSKKDGDLFIGHAAPGKWGMKYPKYYIKDGNFLTEEQYQELVAQEQANEEAAETPAEEGQEGGAEEANEVPMQ